MKIRIKNLPLILISIVLILIPCENLFVISFIGRNFSMSSAFSILSLPIALFLLTRGGKVPQKIIYFIYYSVPFLIYILLTCLWTPDPNTGLIYSIGLCTIFIFLTLFLWVGLTTTKPHYLYFGYMIGCLFMVLIVIQQYLSGLITTRVFLDEFNSNWLSHSLVQGVNMLTLSRMNNLKKIHFYLIFFIVILLGFTIIVLGSRGGSFAYVFALIGFLFAYRKYLTIQDFLLILFLVACMATTGLIEITLPDQLIERYLEAGTSIAEGDLTGRGNIWTQGLEILSFRNLLFLILGTGITSFAEMVGKASHNGFLALFFEIGVLGTFMYFLPVIYLVRCSLNKALVPVFFVLLSLFSSMTIANLQFTSSLWVTLIFLGIFGFKK